MKKALFLDRDGVVNIDKDYVHRIEDFEFIDGIFDLCIEAQKLEYLIFIITNQGGIGRGFYTEEDYQILTKWLLGEFAGKNITISKVYHCPYHPVHGIGGFKKESFDRKPNPGMLLRVRDEFNIDMKSSIMIGDKETDMQAAVAAEVGKALLYGNAPSPTTATKIIKNLHETIELL